MNLAPLQCYSYGCGQDLFYDQCTCLDLECPKCFGIFPHPTCKSKFLTCTWFRPLVQECKPPLIYNPELEVCDWPKYSTSSPQEISLTEQQGQDESENSSENVESTDTSSSESSSEEHYIIDQICPTYEIDASTTPPPPQIIDDVKGVSNPINHQNCPELKKTNGKNLENQSSPSQSYVGSNLCQNLLQDHVQNGVQYRPAVGIVKTKSLSRINDKTGGQDQIIQGEFEYLKEEVDDGNDQPTTEINQTFLPIKQINAILSSNLFQKYKPTEKERTKNASKFDKIQNFQLQIDMTKVKEDPKKEHKNVPNINDMKVKYSITKKSNMDIVPLSKRLSAENEDYYSETNCGACDKIKASTNKNILDTKTVSEDKDATDHDPDFYESIRGINDKISSGQKSNVYSKLNSLLVKLNLSSKKEQNLDRKDIEKYLINSLQNWLREESEKHRNRPTQLSGLSNECVDAEKKFQIGFSSAAKSKGSSSESLSKENSITPGQSSLDENNFRNQNPSIKEETNGKQVYTHGNSFTIHLNNVFHNNDLKSETGLKQDTTLLLQKIDQLNALNKCKRC